MMAHQQNLSSLSLSDRVTAKGERLAELIKLTQSRATTSGAASRAKQALHTVVPDLVALGILGAEVDDDKFWKPEDDETTDDLYAVIGMPEDSHGWGIKELGRAVVKIKSQYQLAAAQNQGAPPNSNSLSDAESAELRSLREICQTQREKLHTLESIEARVLELEGNLETITHSCSEKDQEIQRLQLGQSESTPQALRIKELEDLANHPTPSSLIAAFDNIRVRPNQLDVSDGCKTAICGDAGNPGMTYSLAFARDSSIETTLTYNVLSPTVEIRAIITGVDIWNTTQGTFIRYIPPNTAGNTESAIMQLVSEGPCSQWFRHHQGERIGRVMLEGMRQRLNETYREIGEDPPYPGLED
ncbi:hypothetical protein BT63DRAFT_443161 [Microthyrium microscopicum]|uniref:Uncharacterized protein n=1 Tax=Microthyrium microscopicum TaxID=703497 RepID=A0A6A6TZR9_9PEZI|nr:hypothetical protein BT63DRAFT_443161 [Microthyrium microscopicum]